MKKVLLALAGNQNSGKTTLFNSLTGSNQHVGNFPGVTVEKKTGEVRQYKEATLVDLPGIYSLSPYTNEEIVTRDFILQEHPDVLINIVDATNIERNLYLTLQLMELEQPMVIALNMMDEVNSCGNSIDTKQLSKMLGIPVVAISAARKDGINELLQVVKHIAKDSPKYSQPDFDTGEVGRTIHAISNIIEKHMDQRMYPLRFASTKLVEGDIRMKDVLKLDNDECNRIENRIVHMEDVLQTDREAALADMRYSFIEEVCNICVHKVQETKGQIRSEKIDYWLTHKYLGIPIFIGIMLMIFYATFTLFGGTLQGWLEQSIEQFSVWVSSLLSTYGVSGWLHALLIDGVFAGVGSVLSFLPIIVILFFFLSLLEDSGYMARVAFVMDKSLRKIGLSGRSFVPMLIGFGCSVPGIMSTRTLSSERDRKMTILLTPFMSCSAKLPIYGMMIAAFFTEYTALVMVSVYLLGIVVAIISGLILKKTIFKGDSVPFVMELPSYRLPAMRSVCLHMWEKAKDFLHRAFTIIFIASILIWFLQSFDFQLQYLENSETSILATLGSSVAPIFAPLGFNDWRAVTALVSGITAKESVVSTLSVLTDASDHGLAIAIQSMFTPLSAYAFLAFTVLYMPCIAAFAATKRELGSWIQALLTVGYQTGFAYVVALLIYQIGSFFI